MLTWNFDLHDNSEVQAQNKTNTQKNPLKPRANRKHPGSCQICSERKKTQLNLIKIKVLLAKVLNTLLEEECRECQPRLPSL